MTCCALITDAGLAHFDGVRVLDAIGSPLLTYAGLERLRARGVTVRT